MVHTPTTHSAIDWEGLNAPQQEAVLHTNGPLAVYAGAGSGKTKTICARIAYLIETGVPPSSIMAVTFTNKAAKEMRERVTSMVGPMARSLLVSTFHSSCARFLRLFASEAGYDQNFSIYDDDEQKALLKEVLSELEIKETQLSVPILKSRIDSLKNQGKTVSDLEKEQAEKESESVHDYMKDFPILRRYGEGIQEKLVLEGYRRYQDKLKKQNAMDFNDLLLVTTQLISQNLSVKERLQNRYRYFLVDEFQDTNPIQFSFIHELSSHTQNLCIVGDDDQSIYSWRGADPSFILNFSKIFPNAKIIKLEQNYRSLGTIVKAATEVIAHNSTRTPKRLWTPAEDGDPILVNPCFDSQEEAQWVLSKILSKIKEGGHCGDVGILYRTNAQSRVIEDALRRKMLPYVIFGSVRFYERTEVKNLLCYLRVLVNAQDDAAFQRMVNTPKRGFGDKAMLVLKKAAQEKNVSLLQISQEWAANRTEIDLGRGANSLKQLIFSINKWHEDLKGNIPLGDLVQNILSAIEYQAYIRNQYPEDSDERWQNVIELRNAVQEFSSEITEDTPKSQFELLGKFLEDASLVVEPRFQNVQKGESNAVSLMTIHAAKGLEFKDVFVVGLEEGTLPHVNSLESNKDVEEERRLFYVALTRAREKLFLSHVKKHRFKPDMPCVRSRFISEIPSDYLSFHADNRGSTFFSQSAPLNTLKKNSLPPQRAFTSNVTYGKEKFAGTVMKADHLIYGQSGKAQEDETCPWIFGLKVKHRVFGTGVVQSAEKGADGYRVEVRFPAVGVKKLLHTYLCIE